jgi:hypothetical protein
MTPPIAIEAAYVPGSWVGFAGTRVWLLADLDPADPVVSWCWELVQVGAIVDSLLDALSGSQIRPALDFAIVRMDGAQAELAVHGEAWAEVVTVDSPAFDAAGTAAQGPSREVRAVPGGFGTATVDGLATVCLCAGGTDAGTAGADGATALSLSMGVVQAAAITVRASAPAIRAIPATRAPMTVDGPDGSGEASRFDTMFGQTSLPEPEPDVAAQIPTEWLRGMRLPDLSAGPDAVPPSRADEDSGLPPRPVGGGAPDDGVIDDVSWAVVHADSAAPDPNPRPVPPPFPPAVPVASAGGGIDPELLQTTRRAPGSRVAVGPIVDAVRCAGGHLNPPATEHCRTCAGPVPAQAPQSVPRPPLGVLRLSTGEEVTLDRGVILGRAPGAPQGLGPDEPHRIQLPSPDGSISRKHVEVVLDGWQVTAVDLESTNGTVVSSAGGASKTLSRGGRAVIHHGDVVSLDATTWFRFEVTTS